MSLQNAERQPRRKRYSTDLPSEGPETDSDDVIGLYKRDVGQFSLLSQAEERRLVQAMNRGRVATEELRCQPHLPDESEVKQELLARVKAGRAAQDILISTNLRLVFKVIKHYGFYGMPLPDMVQEGNKGLIRAAEKYVLSKDTRYSTYAFAWIRQKIGLALPHQRDVVSHSYRDDRFLIRIKKARMLLMDIHPENEPSINELLTEVNKRRPHISREKAEYLTEKLKSILELETLTQRDWAEELAESDGSPVERLIYQNLLVEQLHLLLGQLDVLDQQIIALYYGLGSGVPMTFSKLTEIIQQEYVGMSEYMIRKRHKAALRQLEILARDSGVAEMFEARSQELE